MPSRRPIVLNMRRPGLFAAEYVHDGRPVSITLIASSIDDAEAQLSAIGGTGFVVGRVWEITENGGVFGAPVINDNEEEETP